MPKTLLLADDSVTIQKVVGISLASEDITLVAVDNGAAAVAKAKELRPDLILADVVMPQLSGYEVCRQVKADPTLRHIPVLLLTGTFEAFDENKAREVGSDGHITKPFEAQALVDLVNARLAASAAPLPAATPVAAPAAAPKPLFGDDEPFDFMSDEITAPDAKRSAGSDALSFGGADELEADAIDDRGMTSVAIEDSGVALLEDGDDENADTLPPIDAEPEEDDAPAATQVMFAEAPAKPAQDSGAATRVMFGEPEAAGVGTITPAETGAREELFADMIGGTSAPSYAVSATDLGDPFADDPEIALAAAPAPAPAKTTVVFGADEDERWPAAPVAAPPASAPIEPLRALAPSPQTGDALPSRDELRNMLEKMAWEAFGDVTDRIVRETVARVEQIAWEVIPKMAETLIREEIRKLKDGEEQ